VDKRLGVILDSTTKSLSTSSISTAGINLKAAPANVSFPSFAVPSFQTSGFKAVDASSAFNIAPIRFIYLDWEPLPEQLTIRWARIRIGQKI
jgi:hypothetical protein